jgi:hypothetical protein
MANQGQGYRDYFSQAASSLADRSFSPPPTAPNTDELGLFSQSVVGPRPLAPLVTMENLDLNSHIDSFSFLDTYSGYMQPEGGISEQGVPPVALVVHLATAHSILLALTKVEAKIAMVLTH